MRKSELDAEQFRLAEASCLLEGVDVAANPRYRETKARVIAGELDIDDAIRRTVDHYKLLAAIPAPELSVAE